MERFKVIIVEDVPLELKGTEGILHNEMPEADVIATADSEEEFWKQFRQNKPDLVLLDLGLAGSIAHRCVGTYAQHHHFWRRPPHLGFCDAVCGSADEFAHERRACHFARHGDAAAPCLGVGGRFGSRSCGVGAHVLRLASGQRAAFGVQVAFFSIIISNDDANPYKISCFICNSEEKPTFSAKLTPAEVKRLEEMGIGVERVASNSRSATDDTTTVTQAETETENPPETSFSPKEIGDCAKYDLQILRIILVVCKIIKALTLILDPIYAITTQIIELAALACGCWSSPANVSEIVQRLIQVVISAAKMRLSNSMFLARSPS